MRLPVLVVQRLLPCLFGGLAAAVLLIPPAGHGLGRDTSGAVRANEQAATPAATSPQPAATSSQVAAAEPLAEVAPASDEPQQALSAVRVPEGWQRQLYAAEPLVANIVAFDITHDGQLYVAESFRQNRGVTDNRSHDQQWLLADLAAQTVQDRIDYHKRLLGDQVKQYTRYDDRIRRVWDSDGDGTADQAVVYANRFNRIEDGTGAGLLARGNTVYFTCIPKLWMLVDQQGQGQASQRIALSDGYGVRVAFRGHDSHGLIIGPDGRLYFSIGDRGYNVTTDDGRVLSQPDTGAVFRCELDGSGLEVYATGLRNPQELAFNDYGDLFTGDNNSDSGDRARIVMLVPGSDSGWRMHYQYLPDRGPFNQEKIWHPHSPNDQPAYIVPPIANLTDGPSGLAFDPGTGGDPSLRGRFLLADFRGGSANSGVRSFSLEPDGAFYRLDQSDELFWNLLATDVAFGPDGAIWVSDWVEGWDGVGKGRIYRFHGPDFDQTEAQQVQTLLQTPWSDAPLDDLIGNLSHADRRVRNESQWALAERGEVTALATLADSSAASTLARLHAIWGLDQSLRLQTAGDQAAHEAGRTLLRQLDNSDAFLVAAAALAVGERQLAPHQRLAELLNHPSPRVRAFAAQGLAAMPSHPHDSVHQAIVAMLAENNDADPILRHAGIMALAASGHPDRLATLKQHGNVAVRRAAVVALRRLRAVQISEFLQDAEPIVVTEAARAIHDLPLEFAFEPLAQLIRSDHTDPILMRRVLNANYRLGTAAAAAALADYAARPVAPAALRLEAVEMLRDWGQPDPRDRVLNDYRELPQRPAAVAKSALTKTLSLILKNADEVRERAVVVAAQYGISEITPLLQQRIGDDSLRPETRGQALTLLVGLAPDRATELAAQLVGAPQPPLRIAALEVLSQADPQLAEQKLQQAVSSESMAERQAAWDLVAAIDNDQTRQLVASGVRQWLAGEFPADTALNLIEAAQGRLPDDLAGQLDQARAQQVAEDPLNRWILSLQGGDAQRGQEVYSRTQLSCVRCHKIGDSGGEVGPDLSSVGRLRTRRFLLESICLPDAQISEGYETVVIVDDAGQVTAGIVKHDDDDRVQLTLADGNVVEIDADSIVGRRRGKSAMPEELADQITARELRDLVAYLTTLQADPWRYDASLLEPFWESDVVREEPVLFVRDPDSGEARGQLMFPAAEIIAVTRSDRSTTYQPARDYRWTAGSQSIVIPADSQIATHLPSDLRRPPGSQPYRLTHRDGGDEIRFGATLEYHQMQTWVTYRKADAHWPVPPPHDTQTTLPITLGKLRNKQPLSIVLLGDSISTGCNASGWGGGAPFQPPYQDLLLQHLQATSSPQVRLTNLSVGGMSTPWGMTKIDDVMKHQPDLVVIAFGMNDAGGLTPQQYRQNTQAMIDAARQHAADTEFILVATMLGNRDWTTLHHDRFLPFRDALESLTGPGVALADLTSIWQAMLERKADADLTGNGVNHPNDFGHRVYAQVLARLLTP